MVKLYVEGGGDSKELHARLREGYAKLLSRAGFEGRMPRIVAGGGRGQTFDMFKTAIRSGEPAPILLVDSEVPVTGSAWLHLQKHDNWIQPMGTTDDQAQLMVTCMETWVAADHKALSSGFCAEMNIAALPALHDLEARSRQDIQDKLEKATKPCGPKGMYAKGSRSFKILAELNPETLKDRLPHFRRLIETLDRLL